MRKVNQFKQYIQVLLLNAVHGSVILTFSVWVQPDTRTESVLLMSGRGCFVNQRRGSLVVFEPHSFTVFSGIYRDLSLQCLFQGNGQPVPTLWRLRECTSVK